MGATTKTPAPIKGKAQGKAKTARKPKSPVTAAPKVARNRTPTLDECPAIIERVVAGLSLRRACLELGFHPGDALRVIKESPDCAAQYVRACEVRGEFYADQGGGIVQRLIAGTLKPDAARVALDYYKWTAARMAPKTYGDLSKHEHSGPDGAPLPTQSAVIVIHGNGRDDPPAD